MKKTTLIGSLILAASLCASAQPHGGSPPDGKRRGPPPEAVAACKSAQSGANCSFSMGDRTMSGTCAAPEGKTTLASRPKDMPPPPPGSASAPQR